MKNDENIFTVLIVDDDDDLCRILEAVLRKTCQVHIEHNLQSAGDYLARLKPGIILLDNNLPDGSGVLFIKRIIGFYPDAKVVLMTADRSAGLKEEAIGEGAFNFISKPFRAATINELIFSIFPKPHAA